MAQVTLLFESWHVQWFYWWCTQTDWFTRVWPQPCNREALGKGGWWIWRILIISDWFRTGWETTHFLCWRFNVELKANKDLNLEETDATPHMLRILPPAWMDPRYGFGTESWHATRWMAITGTSSWNGVAKLIEDVHMHQLRYLNLCAMAHLYEEKRSKIDVAACIFRWSSYNKAGVFPRMLVLMRLSCRDIKPFHWHLRMRFLLA